jgi:hypothetical protein
VEEVSSQVVMWENSSIKQGLEVALGVVALGAQGMVSFTEDYQRWGKGRNYATLSRRIL